MEDFLLGKLLLIQTEINDNRYMNGKYDNQHVLPKFSGLRRYYLYNCPDDKGSKQQY